MCRDIFRVEARALGLFFDRMVNTFDPDAWAAARVRIPTLVP